MGQTAWLRGYQSVSCTLDELDDHALLKHTGTQATERCFLTWDGTGYLNLKIQGWALLIMLKKPFIVKLYGIAYPTFQGT